MSDDRLISFALICILAFAVLTGFILVLADHARSDNNYIIKTENITISGTDFGNFLSPYYVFSSTGCKYDVAVKNRHIYKYAQSHQCHDVTITYKEYCDGRNREVIAMFDGCYKVITDDWESCNDYQYNSCNSCRQSTPCNSCNNQHTSCRC